MGKFLAGLKNAGIRRTDPRVRELMDNLKKVHKQSNYETGASAETQNLNREAFKTLVFLLLLVYYYNSTFVDFFSGLLLRTLYLSPRPSASNSLYRTLPASSPISKRSSGSARRITKGKWPIIYRNCRDTVRSVGAQVFAPLTVNVTRSVTTNVPLPCRVAGN